MEINTDKFYSTHMVKPITKPAAVSQFEKRAYEIQKATDRLDMIV